MAVRQKGFFVTLILAVLLALPQWTVAAKVEGLYRDEIPVSGQGEREREQAVSRALGDVIVKVAGQRQPLSNPKIRAAMDSPSSYIQGFGYQKQSSESGSQQVLQVAFNEQAVNNLLRQAGVAIWGVSRPTTLMWLAVDDGIGRDILKSGAELPSVMEVQFRNRGLPMTLPLMDFEDSTAVSTVDVWGLFTSRLVDASRRYGAEAVIAARLNQSGERYNGRITLIFRGERSDISIENMVAAGVSQKTADLLGNALSSHYAVFEGEVNSKPVLVVEGISNVNDYAALTDYLEGLTAVRDLSVRKVKGSTVELELSIDGSVDQLSDSLALGRKLVTDSEGGFNRSAGTQLSGQTGFGKGAVLKYRWVRF